MNKLHGGQHDEHIGARMRQAVLNILGGFAAVSLAELADMGARSDWLDLAKREQTRRAARILESFDDETLAAIASGEIDLQALCKEAAVGRKEAI